MSCGIATGIVLLLLAADLGQRLQPAHLDAEVLGLDVMNTPSDSDQAVSDAGLLHMRPALRHRILTLLLRTDGIACDFC